MIYYLTTFPGLAGVLAREAREKLGADARVTDVLRTRHNDASMMKYDGAPRELLKLRTAEDVFVAVGRLKLTGQPSDTRVLATAGFWQGALREALRIWTEISGKPLTKRLTWRVVVQADDVAWRQYKRQELTLAAEGALIRTGSWRINREAAPLELWLWQVGRELIVALRLSTDVDRQHGGREVERSAALRPSVAAAMVLLSRPEPGDVFLDPMCGTGTLLLERAVVGRYELLLGGDSDEGAVRATLANFGLRHQPRRVERWDARRLPLEDGSVTKIVCNLPWGRQIGEKTAMPALYRGFLAEAARVLAPAGRLVLLTSEWDALRTELARRSELTVEETIRDVQILGRRADIFVATKG